MRMCPVLSVGGMPIYCVQALKALPIEYEASGLSNLFHFEGISPTNTRTKLFALTLSALAAGASLAQSGEAGYIEGKPFQTTRTRLVAL